jgi:hypothetical protein
MSIYAVGKLIETEDIEIQCGIFQADSLSPPPFCNSFMPLTDWPNKLNTGYEEHITNTEVSHLLYVDDLKVQVKTEEELQKQMQAVRTFSNDTHMEFELDQCATIILKKGKLVHSQNLILDTKREI